MPGGLLTDLYELNMAASYLQRDMSEQATFSLFVRRLPPGRGFLVAAGLDDGLRFLEEFRFGEDELEYLRGVIDLDERTVGRLRDMRFTGQVYAVPEGRIVFANEPLLEVTAPIAEAQVVETYLLNQITYQTAIASKAARFRVAARGKRLIDFALRRTHGMEAGMAVARLSGMVGFEATSNVEAGRRWGLRVAGTMAHSYVEAFPREIDAFRAFATDRPGPKIFLVDTYDTLEGVRNAVRVVAELGLTGPVGVRLDSGDLAELAVQARRILDDAGLESAAIFASGGLDELSIDELVSAGVPIDAFGVGTRMGVSSDAPSLDSAYKLVAYGGREVLKLSSGKVTAPGPKQVFRSPGMQDVLCLREEHGQPNAEPLLREVMAGGRRLDAPQSLEASRNRFERDLEALPDGCRDLRDPQPVVVAVSPALERRTREVIDEIRGRDAGAQ